jgi:phage terminase large subunit-like protein
MEFPDQVDKIREWHQMWRPEMIGIESNAFQRSLAQMSYRIEGLPPIVPVMSAGNKNERILRMSPLFKIGRVRINKRHSEFIDQWVNFDPEKKNQKDDLLDAVEIGLGVANVLMPRAPFKATLEPETPSQEATARIRQLREKRNRPYDPELGSEA